MASRTSQWRYINNQLLKCLENCSDQEMRIQTVQVDNNGDQNLSMSNDVCSKDVDVLSTGSSTDSFAIPFSNIDQDQPESDSTTSDCYSEDDFVNESNLLSDLGTWTMRQNMLH